MTTLSGEWEDALRRMRRNNPIYKPAVLLAAVWLVHEGASPASMSLLELKAGYDQLMGHTSQVRPAAISHPVAALANDRILAPEGSAGQGTVAFTSELRSNLASPEGRAAVRERLLQMLESDGKQLSDELRRAAHPLD